MQKTKKIESNLGPLLGCIADDFTGASDLASVLVASGMRTIQVNGVPSPAELSQLPDVDALVIALKTRSVPSDVAIAESLAALAVLQSMHCQQYYFKYCSTFDSSSEGNIGPVIDALLHELKASSTIVCPAFPINGRTVYQGHLFVFDQLLQDSPMRDHPVTPMKDSSLIRLVEAQGKGRAVNIPFDVVEKGPEALAATLRELSRKYTYLVVDALTEKHLVHLGRACSGFKLITGGSGLATDLCAEFEAKGFVRRSARGAVSPLPSPALVLSGSCSAMTQQQVQQYKHKNAALQIDPIKLHDGRQTLAGIVAWLIAQIPKGAPLIYATADADRVSHVHKSLGSAASQHLLEETLSEVAYKSLELGVRNIIVAGGETSGAVVRRLGLRAFKIGETITPGVPMLQTLGDRKINLALKSGNFGQIDFFKSAVESLTC